MLGSYGISLLPIFSDVSCASHGMDPCEWNPLPAVLLSPFSKTRLVLHRLLGGTSLAALPE